MSLESMYEMLTDEQKARASACKTPEDLLKLAQEEGYDLNDEEIEGIAGGLSWSGCQCDEGYCPDDSNAWS